MKLGSRSRGEPVESRRFSIRRLHRAGRSVQVTIPAEIARTVGLKQGDQVWVYLVGHVLCMKRFEDGGFTPDVVGVRSVPLPGAELAE